MSNRADENLWVDRLVAAARSGATLDLSAGARAEHYNPATVGNWTVDRSIPATAIRRVLVDDHGKFDPRGLRIQGARITGTSTFTHVKFDYPLHFRRCVIDQPIDLRYSKFSELSFDRSHIKTLNMEGAAIGTLLAAGLRADGEIRLLGARIEGPLVLEDAILQNPGKSVLTLDRTTATAGLCAPGLRTEGMISAPGVRIEGPLVLEGAVLQNPGKPVLTLDGATVTGGLLAARLRAEGETRFFGVRIEGQLALEGAVLQNPGKPVLTLDGATVTVLFAGELRATGETRLLGARIEGPLVLHGAILQNPGEPAFSLDGARVSGGLFAAELRATGETRLLGARIEGQLVLHGAILQNPGKYAFTLDLATVTGGLFATGLRTDGMVSVRSAQIEGQFNLTDAALINGQRAALSLQTSQVGKLILHTKSPIIVDLSRARIGDLLTPSSQEPQGRLIATGWELGDVRGAIRTDRHAAARWLGTLPPEEDFAAQPWHALAAVYDRNGHPAEARRLRFTAASKVTENSPWPTKILRWMYRLVAGHGYYPLLAAAWLIIVLALGIALVENNREHFVPTDDTKARAAAESYTDTNWLESPNAEIPCAQYPNYPCFDSFAYALNGVIPAATGALRPDWAITTHAPLMLTLGLPALRVLAWILTALLLAGVTGLLRKN